MQIIVYSTSNHDQRITYPELKKLPTFLSFFTSEKFHRKQQQELRKLDVRIRQM